MKNFQYKIDRPSEPWSQVQKQMQGRLEELGLV